MNAHLTTSESESILSFDSVVNPPMPGQEPGEEW